MSDGLRDQIYNNMDLKNTDELLDIWQTNDREEWSETAFDVIREILRSRGVDPPEQDEFVPREIDQADYKEDNFTEAELGIIEDKNPPVFYDPYEVLKTSKWIELAAKVMVGFVILNNLTQYSSANDMVKVLFILNPNPLLESIITILLITIVAAPSAAIIYFALITLSRILKILMEMEFNSRK